MLLLGREYELCGDVNRDEGKRVVLRFLVSFLKLMAIGLV